MQTVGFDPSCGQFDRECHAIELSADGDDDCGFVVAEVQVRATCHRAFDAEPWRRNPRGDPRRKPRLVRRTGKRPQPVDMLALDLESLTARREHVNLWRGRKEGRG